MFSGLKSIQNNVLLCIPQSDSNPGIVFLPMYFYICTRFTRRSHNCEWEYTFLVELPSACKTMKLRVRFLNSGINISFLILLLIIIIIKGRMKEDSFFFPFSLAGYRLSNTVNTVLSRHISEFLTNSWRIFDSILCYQCKFRPKEQFVIATLNLCFSKLSSLFILIFLCSSLFLYINYYRIIFTFFFIRYYYNGIVFIWATKGMDGRFTLSLTVSQPD